LIRVESSLMARSNSLLSHKKYPVVARREFPSIALKLPKLQAITELDLEELQSIDPPRGYGRD
jgi:hypothetical protein